VPDDIERTIAEASERGLVMDGPRAGGRLRPDGTRLEWQIGTPRTPDLPFLCADVTPRELRVPGGKAWEHQNGVVGILEVRLFVEDLEASTERYGALVGIEVPMPDYPSTAMLRDASFHLGDTKITLSQLPETQARFVKARGGAFLHGLILRSTKDVNGFSDDEYTHGVQFGIDSGNGMGGLSS
jgi:hypothetical protein